MIPDLVKEQPGVHIAALVGQLDKQSVDNIYALNSSTRIYIDVRAAPVAEPDRVRIFRDAETARANGRLNADNNGRLVRASPADLREANRSYAILAPYLTGMPPSLRSLLRIVVVAPEELSTRSMTSPFG